MKPTTKMNNDDDQQYNTSLKSVPLKNDDEDDDLNHNKNISNECHQSIIVQRTDSMSSISTKSTSSNSTQCDSCNRDQVNSGNDHQCNHSLVICNFNATEQRTTSISDVDSDQDLNDEDSVFVNVDEEEEDDNDDDYIDMFSYRSTNSNDSTLTLDMIETFRNIKSPYKSFGYSDHHILLLESYAINRTHLLDFPNKQSMIVEKICSKSDLNDFNLHLFLLDQFVHYFLDDNNQSSINQMNDSKSIYRKMFQDYPLQRRSSERSRSHHRTSPLDSQYVICEKTSRILKGFTNSNFQTKKISISYLDQPFIEAYLDLIEQLIDITNEQKEMKQNKSTPDSIADQISNRQRKCAKQLTHFCLKLFTQFPELIQDMAETLSELMKRLGYLTLPNIHVPSVPIVLAHFSAMKNESGCLNSFELDPTRIDRLVKSLYSEYNLVPLFQLYYSAASFVRGKFCKSIERRYQLDPSLNNEKLFQKFYRSAFVNRKSPLLNVLHDLTVDINDINGEKYHRSLVAFCYRATICRYANCLINSVGCDFINGEDDSENLNIEHNELHQSYRHSYSTHPINNLTEPVCRMLVGHLYKLTIQLILLSSVYSIDVGNQFLKRLLQIQVDDFDFRTYLQQSVEIIDCELNSINFDLQNQQNDHDPLMIDLDDMDDEQMIHLDHGIFMVTNSSTTFNVNHQHHHHHQHLGPQSASASPSSILSTPSSSTSSVSSLEISNFSNYNWVSSSSSIANNSDVESRPTSTSPPPLAKVSMHSSFDVNNNSMDPYATTSNGDSGGNSQRHRIGGRTNRSSLSSSNDSVDIPISLSEKRSMLDRMKNQGKTLLAPNNRWSYQECAICCETQWLLVRTCCLFPACLDCLSQYYTGRVEMGNLSIECIRTECHELVYRAEVNARLGPEKRSLYNRLLLLQSSESDRSKPCPQCNTILTLLPETEQKMKQTNKLLYGAKRFILETFRWKKRSKESSPNSVKSSSFMFEANIFKVECERCKFNWCFKCHSPWHEGLTCKQFMKGDTLLKSWAKNIDFNGQVNAQKCPKCKIYIQRTSGCDHMLCTKCKTDFCYKCGDRLRQIKFFGDHYSRLSILGCKYRYKPDKPLQRKIIRGTVFSGKLMLLPVLSMVCLCAGAIVLTMGIAALPLFGGVRVYRRLARTGSISNRHRMNGRLFHNGSMEIPPTTNTSSINAHNIGRARLNGRRMNRALVQYSNELINGNMETANNDDTWNRTVQMYNNRLRNRSRILVETLPSPFSVNSNHRTSHFNDTSDTTDVSSFQQKMTLHSISLNPNDDADEKNDLEHDELESSIINSSNNNNGFPYYLQYTPAMRLHNPRNGRNAVVLNLTTDDLGEIIDESYAKQKSKSSKHNHHHHHHHRHHHHRRRRQQKSSKSKSLEDKSSKECKSENAEHLEQVSK